jgi:hypothetical protein
MDEQNIPNLPNPLTTLQIEAVRFQITKPGYSFEQVESFIDKVKHTLQFLESEMRKDKLALAEGQDEIELLTERSQIMGATLEIFKVKGDAVVSSDGEYVTESKVNASRLLEENTHLKEQLRISQEDANSGWEAEADLRRYIEENLLPWLEKHKDAIVGTDSVSSDAVEPETEVIPLIPDEELYPATEAISPSVELETPSEEQAEAPTGEGLDDEDFNVEGIVSLEEIMEEISPTDIEYEEEITHTEHISENLGSHPTLGSDEESDWFK